MPLTDIGAPDKPQVVTATAVGETAIKLEWTVPGSTNNGSPIDRYESLDDGTTTARCSGVGTALPAECITVSASAENHDPQRT